MKTYIKLKTYTYIKITDKEKDFKKEKKLLKSFYCSVETTFTEKAAKVSPFLPIAFA